MRAMSAMQAFYAAKADYEARSLCLLVAFSFSALLRAPESRAVCAAFQATLKPLEEGTVEYQAAEEAVFLRSAEKALAVARANGGVYVKAAQFVASMQGGGGDRLVPRVLVDALKVLTDRAPFRPFSEMEAVLVEELGGPATRLFASIDPTPVAAASLAQVHRGVTLAGEPVAIKIQYPELRANLASDLSVFRTMGSQMRPGGMDLTWLLDDFESFLQSETDFRGEAANTAAAAAALAGRPDVLVPAVHSSLSSARVLTTAFVQGLVRIDDDAGLASAGLRPADVGHLLASTFADTVLRGGWVHGDPHGGNVYVVPRAVGRAPPGALAAALLQRAEGAEAALRAAGAPRVSAGARALAAALRPPAFLPTLVLLDHGLHHNLDETTRVALCALLLACVRARPAAMRAASQALASGRPGAPPPPPAVARFFPLALSHCFVFGVGLLSVTPEEVAAARAGRMPPGLSMADLSDFLAGLHGSGGNVLGVIHALGYTRGLLNSLRFPERRRLRVLARAAALGAAREPDSAGAELAARLAAARADFLVWLLIPLMAIVAPMYHLVLRPLAGAKDLAALLFFAAAIALASLAAA